MQCTARSGDTLTVVRGAEGTSAQAFNIGDNVQLRITAAGMNFLTGQAVISTEEETQTATQGQTVFTLVNFDYATGTNNLAVFVNGSKQVSGVNYSETNVNTVTFNTGLNAGDIVEFLVGVSVAAGTLFANDVLYNEGSTGAVTRTVEKKLQESISVLDFGADPTGVANSSTAFQNAINALSSDGGTILVPTGTYLLNTTPTWGTKSIFWDISVAANFTGSGGGAGNFPIMATNNGQLAVGPFIQSQSSEPGSTGGGIAAFNVEMLQPDDYVGQSVALYAGAISDAPDAASNVWSINTVLQANVNAGGIFTGYEMDVNNFSPTAYVKGLSITGLGTYNPDIGIEIVRVTGTSWKIGQLIQNSNDALVINSQTGGRGIVINPPGSAALTVTNVALTLKQFSNNSETILLQRSTDTSPTGYFLRAVNAANSANLLLIDVDGNIGGSGLQAFGSASGLPNTGVCISGETSGTASSGGGSAAPGAVSGYIVIKVSGTNKKIPYYNV